MLNVFTSTWKTLEPLRAKNAAVKKNLFLKTLNYASCLQQIHILMIIIIK